MRCSATVTDASLAIRSRLSPRDRQCLRAAVTKDGLCRQHAAVRYCAAHGCHSRASKRVGKWWFCKHHARLWKDHEAIYQKIVRIPACD